MKKSIFSILLFTCLCQQLTAQLPDLPSGGATAYNPQTLYAGSYVIAMDNTNQGNGTIFNVKAYGLIVYLLNNNVKVKWVIKPGKVKDGIDFSVNASQIQPTAGSAANYDFRAGPFVIFSQDVAGVAALIDAFNSPLGTTAKVRVYQTNADALVDVRYDLTGFKPKAAILNDGNNASIHTGYMTAASIPSANYALESTGANLLTNCYTFASEPHNESSTSTLIGQIRTFVQNGGNFLAQCEAVRTYENEAVNGRFQSTRADAGAVFEKGAGGNSNASISTNIAFPNPDLSYSQFQGSFDGNLGGSLRNWKLTSGSSYAGSTHDHAHGSAIPGAVSASVAKLLPANRKGGLVFYLGNHEYNVNNQVNANGMRMYLNAFLTPTDLLGSLQFAVVAQCLNTLDEPTVINVNSATGPTSAYPLTVNLYADITAPFGQQNAGDVLLGTALINSAGGPAQQISIPAVGPLSQYRRNTPYVAVITPQAGCLQAVTFIPNQCASTLPVNFTLFTATRNRDIVTLKWETGSEQNNNGFAVERNINGTWQQVGWVSSQAVGGNSNGVLKYTFIDPNTTKGITQYRIRQVDLDARSVYSEIRSVRGGEQAGKTIVYPNPSSDGRVNIVFEETGAGLVREIALADMSGRIIRQQKGITNNNLVIENLIPGVYTLRIFIPATGEQVIEKIVVNKR